MVTIIKRSEFEVLDKRIEREVGGVKIQERPGGKRVVSMTLDQARMFLDHGAIRPLDAAPAPATPKPGNG
jgi:hypothetical protein